MNDKLTKIDKTIYRMVRSTIRLIILFLSKCSKQEVKGSEKLL